MLPRDVRRANRATRRRTGAGDQAARRKRRDRLVVTLLILTWIWLFLKWVSPDHAGHVLRVLLDLLSSL